ncbi:MAG: efflux RND transporter permease subunit [Defluviitaleaceae bacterium]|nr:efflux RND transporter permease subunit [Defluviitaleaceae bacterium]
MIEKFSVKKPLTVLVGVILIVVLGFISFANTTMDLLPSMDLPFVIVVTQYVGATPEQVEADVSIPIEGSMATLSGISTVQSISNEHFSLVMLEFTGTTNMDSASLEIRESLDMLNLPEGVSRPMMLRLNPNMMPIMTGNLYVRGMDIEEISTFARTVAAPAIEGVAGVGSVSLSGLVQNQLHVVIRDDYIQAINAQIATTMGIMMEQMMEAMMAEMFAEAMEATIAGLMAEGMPLEMAQMMAPDIVAEQMAMMAEMAEHPPENGEDMPEMGIPAEMLTVEMIANILTAQHFAMPAGTITEAGFEHMVRVGDRFETVDEIKNLLLFDIGAMAGIEGLELEPVRLSDVAAVFVTDDSHLSFTRVNNNPSVMFTMQAQSGFAVADVTSDVRERLAALENEHTGFGFAILMDQGEMIDMVVGSVLNNLIFGGILAVLVLLLFLRDIRPTLVVAVAIPVSLMLAFTLMYFVGISLNMLSMGGLALTVGMLIDNSIAVIENIFRKKRDGVSAARAAVYGTRQMVGAITAATLTTSAMFAPIVFTTGITRQLFADFALTIVFSLVASLLVAMTVVPAASSVLMGKVKKEEGKTFTKIVDFYEKALRGALRFKWLVLAFSIGAFVLSMWAIGRQGMELFPDMEMPQLTVSAEMPEGSTFEDAAAVAEVFSERVFAMSDVETVGVQVGGGGMMAMMGMGFGGGGGGDSTNITMYVLMYADREMTSDELSREIQTIGEGLGLELDVEGADGGMGMMMGAQISLRVEGTELDHIRDTAINLANLVSTVEGAINLTDLEAEGAQELRVTVNKDAAMAHGLTVAQVFMAAMDSLSADERTMNMTLDGTNFEIVISDGDFVEPDLHALENMQLATANGHVYLYQIATIHEDIGLTSIGRVDGNRFVTITGEIEDGFNVGLVNDEIGVLLETFETIGDTRVVIGGEAEAIADAMGDLMLMLLLGLLFTYLIMVAQFQSLLSPFIIMLTIPLAFTGGFAALMIFGLPMSIVSMIGLILLAGVSINTGIVLISRIKQERWQGVPKLDAIIDAGRKRLRPILMTAISTIFAMSVLAIGIGEGAEMMQPMAIATIGGLVYSTIMTLFIVPILYDMLNKNKDITKEDLDTPDITE